MCSLSHCKCNADSGCQPQTYPQSNIKRRLLQVTDQIRRCAAVGSLGTASSLSSTCGMILDDDQDVCGRSSAQVTWPGLHILL